LVVKFLIFLLMLIILRSIYKISTRICVYHSLKLVRIKNCYILVLVYSFYFTKGTKKLITPISQYGF